MIRHNTGKASQREQVIGHSHIQEELGVAGSIEKEEGQPHCLEGEVLIRIDS